MTAIRLVIALWLGVGHLGAGAPGGIEHKPNPGPAAQSTTGSAAPRDSSGEAASPDKSSQATTTQGAKPMTERATFGAGCFWGVEERFRQTPGVVSTAAGYMGGSVRNPTYQQVCTDRTGHAEVVQVEFDPTRIRYEELLEIFWKAHNPTQLNRQGPDVGSQYRSVIFFHSPAQQATAQSSLEKLAASGRYNRPIVTKIESATEFWRAEEYHQQYLSKRGLPSCSVSEGP